VVFGCGNVGMRTLAFIGSERVDYFCDNNAGFIGRIIDGKEVIGYDRLLRLRESGDVLILLGVNGYHAKNVAQQLENDGIYDFIVAGQLPGFESGQRIKEDLYIAILDKSGRYEYAVRYMKKRYLDEKKQNQYLKRHMDISLMSPAVGKLREKQLEATAKAGKAFRFLDQNCPVKCWITGGTLIGKMRHSGFIPWDDDLDFGIMREDVRRLMDFFSQYSAVVRTGLDSEKCVGQGKYFLKISPDFMRICFKEEAGTKIALELFPFDYYVSDLSIEEYHTYVSDGFMKKKQSMEEWFPYCRSQIENSGIVSKTPTDKILPGIDSFQYRGLWSIEDFLPPCAIFPLKEADFEGEKFWCVNDEERYMEHEYPDWRGFPEDIRADEEVDE